MNHTHLFTDIAPLALYAAVLSYAYHFKMRHAGHVLYPLVRLLERLQDLTAPPVYPPSIPGLDIPLRRLLGRWLLVQANRAVKLLTYSLTTCEYCLAGQLGLLIAWLEHYPWGYALSAVPMAIVWVFVLHRVTSNRHGS